MAELVNSKIESQPINSIYGFWRVVFAGLLVGFICWFFVVSLSRYYTDTNVISGVATIIAAFFGVITMLIMRVGRPLIVACASVAVLWTLYSFTKSFNWYESIIWYMSLYSLTYILFSWISRFKNTIAALIIVLLISLSVRIFISL